MTAAEYVKYRIAKQSPEEIGKYLMHIIIEGTNLFLKYGILKIVDGKIIVDNNPRAVHASRMGTYMTYQVPEKNF